MKMMLRDADIHELGMQGVISPYSNKLLNPVSYDVTLGNTFRKMSNPFMKATPYDSDPTPFFESKTEIEDYKYYVLAPGDAVLATTKESVRLPNNIAAELMGKSTIGRWFVSIHVTAGLIDPGFEGEITLEIVNLGKCSVRLNPGMRIGQLVFHKLYNDVNRPYGHADLGSHYQKQNEATLPWNKRTL